MTMRFIAEILANKTYWRMHNSEIQ